MPAIAKGPISHALLDESGRPKSFLTFNTGDFISDDDVSKLGGFSGPNRHNFVPIEQGTSHEPAPETPAAAAPPAKPAPPPPDPAPAPDSGKSVSLKAGDTASKTTEAAS